MGSLTKTRQPANMAHPWFGKGCLKGHINNLEPILSPLSSLQKKVLSIKTAGCFLRSRYLKRECNILLAEDS